MSGSTLVWREPLWLLLALMPLLQLLWRRWRLRRDNAFAEAALMPWLRIPGEQRIWRRLLSRNTAYLLGWLFLGVALAGPRQPLPLFGEALPSGHTVLAIVDFSRSMAAEDVLPSRQQRAVLELYELLEQARGDRIGVMVFAGRAHLYVPPTDDAAALRFYLASLDRLVLPTRGSNLTRALELATRTLAGEPSASVVVLSDGDFGEGLSDLEQALEALTISGIDLYVLGLGTPEGEAVPLPDGGWLQHEGQPVITRLNEVRLQALAEAGGGSYRRAAGDGSDWSALYGQMKRRGETVAAEEEATGQLSWREYYPWALLPALLLLFVTLMPYRLLPKGQAALLLVGLFLGLQAPGEVMAGETDALREAGRAWQSGEYAQAASLYALHSGYAGRMGEGASYYREEDFAAAAQQFSRAVLLAADDEERADALYNLGNSLFRQGDYAAAATVFADVALYQPEDEAAKHNQALSKALLQAVAEELEGGTAARAGRGPRSARAGEGLDIGKSSSLSIDDSEQQTALPLPPDAVESLIDRGVEHATLAGGGGTERTSPAWQQDMAQAHLRMQRLEGAPEVVWKRLFEIEEGFPAPLDAPRNRPELAPW